MQIKELGYVVIDATDIEAWKRYGANVLGAMPVEVPGLGLRIRLDERDCRMLVLPADTDGVHAMGWLVTDEIAFAEARRDVEAAGCAVESGSPEDCQARRVRALFRFSDPAGLVHEIAWGPVINFKQPFVSPVGVPRFVTGVQGLGHIVNGCSPEVFDATHQFFQDVLGMRVANFRAQAVQDAKVRFPVNWYHCGNPRQHTMALAPAGAAHCRHIMLEVPTIDDMGLAYDRAERNGVNFASTMGRHVNDRAISFYMESPGGFWIEYGCDAPMRNWEEEIAFDDGGHGTVWGHKWLRSL